MLVKRPPGPLQNKNKTFTVVSTKDFTVNHVLNFSLRRSTVKSTKPAANVCHDYALVIYILCSLTTLNSFVIFILLCIYLFLYNQNSILNVNDIMVN